MSRDQDQYAKDVDPSVGEDALNNLRSLDEFVQLLMKVEEPEVTGCVRNIPNDLRRSPLNPHQFETVRLGLTDARRLDRLTTDLRNQTSIEWMSDEELDDVLWHLVCEVALSQGLLRDAEPRQTRIRKLLALIQRPLKRYDVLIPIQYLAPPTIPVQVGDVQILTATDEVLAPFRSAIMPQMLNAPLEVYRGFAMVQMREFGTSTEAVGRRARKKARARLHLLRSYIGEWTPLTNRLFRLDDATFVQPTDGPPGCALHLRSGPEPRSLQLEPGHESRLRELAANWDRLLHCSTDIRQSAELAYHWIGTGLMEAQPSRRIRDFATALEVLLILRERNAKRAWLAYRMCALAATLGRSMLHPSALYVAYDARSDVAHKGRLELQNEESASQLYQAAQDSARWLIELAATEQDATRSELLQRLDTQSMREQTRKWLQGFNDAASRELMGELERLWERNPVQGTK